jgi:hypothetical protein
VAAVSALLSLAHTLTNGSPWWQEAKATYPLLLIETLYNVAVVSVFFQFARLPSMTAGCKIHVLTGAETFCTARLPSNKR